MQRSFHRRTYIQDSHDFQEAQAELGESEIRRIINTIPTMAWSCQPDGKVDFLSERWLEFAGLTLQQFIDEPHRAIHPDDFPGVFERWQKAIIIGKAYDDEMRLKRFDGNYRWFLIKTAPLKNEENKIIKWYGISIEIEDKKRAEEEKEFQQRDKEALINSTDDLMWSISQDMKLIALNKAFIKTLKETTGFTVQAGDDVLMHSILPDEVITFWKERYNRAFSGETFKEDTVLRGVNESTEAWWETSYNPIYENETVVAVACHSRNVTDRKNTERYLQQSNEEIRRLSGHLQKVREEERKSIAREIHDELGQQLTAIKMDIAWIDKQTPVEPSSIKDKLNNIKRLINGSNLSLKRILTELRPRVLDDYGLLEALQWLDRQFTNNTGIQTKFSRPETEIDVNEQTATCIFRVCQEAFTNITRHSQATKVLFAIQQVGEKIILSIEDDGIGFDAEVIQVKNTFGILGMKERVLSMDGFFEIYSAPNKGTIILVSLPLNIEKNRDTTRKNQ